MKTIKVMIHGYGSMPQVVERIDWNYYYKKVVRWLKQNKK